VAAGLPGLGISGLFYLLGALLMPAVEVLRRASGRNAPRPWRTVIAPALLAWGTLLTIALTAWIVGALASLPLPESGATEGSVSGAVVQVGATYGIPTIPAGLATLGLLAAVLVSVQIVRCLLAFRAQRFRAQASHLSSVRGTAHTGAGPIGNRAA
jgi:hypothetical protein